MNFIRYIAIILFSIAFTPSLAFAVCEDCDWDNYLSELSKAEGATDSCVGGGGYYTCVGPLIEDPDSSHYGDRPYGLYQFMPNTLAGYGITDIDAFLADPELQDEIAYQFTMDNLECIYNSSDFNADSGYSCSALAAAAHLGGCGGAVKVSNGGYTADAVNNNYTTADRAAEYQDVCTGGIASPSYNRGSNTLLGCDPDVLESAEAIVDAANQAAMEAVDAMISQPQPAEVATCADQYLVQAESIANTASQNQSGAIEGKVQPVTGAELSAYLESAHITGSVASLITDTYVAVATAFETLTGGITSSLGLDSALASSNCDMINNAWLIQDCIAMPEIPNLSDIINVSLGEMSGAIDPLTSPESLKEMACSGAEDLLGDFMGDFNSAFDDAATAISTPITDSVDDIGL